VIAPIDLRVSLGAVDPVLEVRLEWTTAGAPPFMVLRGIDASTVRSSPDDIFRNVTDFFYLDTSAPGPLTFYSVEAQ
jgi:hypothetical protein